MDRLRLIEEIRKRPALWDFQSIENKSRIYVPDLWKEVAASMGPDVTVDDCKRKWKNLRDAYRAEIKRIEYRIEKDLLKGVYDPKYDYGSKWAYFKAMRFIKDIKRPRRSNVSKNINTSCNENPYTLSDENMYALSDDNINSLSNDNIHHNITTDHYNDDNDSIQFHQYHNMENIKMEPELETDIEIHSVGDDDDDDGDDANEMYGEQLFKEAEKLQQQAQMENSQQSPTPMKMYNSTENSMDNKKPTNDNGPSSSSSSSTNCKCSKRSIDQVHFLEDLKKEEQNLIKSTRLDITRSDELAHVGDSDYNFLVSFLPQMKKMSELQNLQFRAKMTDLMLTIMSPTVSAEPKVAVSSSQGAASCGNFNNYS